MLSASVRQFIQDHLNDDLHRLLLSAHRYPEVPMPQAIAQIEALRKVQVKIPAWYRFDLILPPVLSIEQASSEHTAQFKAQLFSGKSMVDLTGGMGIDAYFFAQNFDHVNYVEQDSMLVDRARQNFEVLGATNINCVHANANEFVNQTSEHYDLVYLDPARRDQQSRRVFRFEDCQPNILEIKDALLNRADRILLKTAPMLDLQLAAEQLGTVARIWVISVNNECKEVLYLLEKTVLPAPEIPIEAVSLGKETVKFTFTRAAEQAAAPSYSKPLRYLYEPDAAILKAGAFKYFAQNFGLGKINPNTHLYTSEVFVPDVPGRCFVIEAVLKYNRKAVRTVIPEAKANVAARNFPDSVDQIRKKLGLADGGEWYVFGVQDNADRKILLACRRVLDNTLYSPTYLL